MIAAAYDGKEDYTYTYDNIGNRVQSRELAASRSYTSNRLNQYVRIEQQNAGNAFTPEFDVHGNQTRIQTRTGVWDVLYDMRNRPEQFAGDGHSVVCSYDFMGRRTDRLEYHGNTLTSREHFIYKGYVQIAAYKLDAEGQSGDCFVLSKSCYWDPSQPTATRILAMKDATDATMLYAACDTVKNITALYDDAGTCRARYAYSPYGEKLIEEGDKHTANAFGFSSEYDDSPLGLYYYNYRYLNPNDGRWINRDYINESKTINLYIYSKNSIYISIDYLGLACFVITILVNENDLDMAGKKDKYVNELKILEEEINTYGLLFNENTMITKVRILTEEEKGGKYQTIEAKKIKTKEDLMKTIEHEKLSFIKNIWNEGKSKIENEIKSTMLLMSEEYDTLDIVAHGGFDLSDKPGCIIGPYERMPHSVVNNLINEFDKKERAHYTSCFQDGEKMQRAKPIPGSVVKVQRDTDKKFCFINIKPPSIRRII